MKKFIMHKSMLYIAQLLNMILVPNLYIIIMGIGTTKP